MKKLFLIILAAMGILQPVKSQCPPNAAAILSTYIICPEGCGVLLQGWPEGVIVNIYGGSPIRVITSVTIPGVYGGGGTGNAFGCVPCNVPLIFASAIPGANNGCVIVTAGTLPVKLSNFSLSAIGNRACLVKWTTYNENAGIIYTIQRSKNSRNFADIAILNSNGKNSHTYSYTDKTLEPGTQYFRIKITDVTGIVSYSETALIKNQTDLGLSIYPNPAENDFKITIPAQYLPATITIYNAEGKAVHSSTTLQSAVSINGRFTKGIYAVRVTGNNRVSITQTLLVK